MIESSRLGGAAELHGKAIRIGTTGWSIPKQNFQEFAQTGSNLQRYAERLGAAEINSSFYRPHRPGTYARWAETVPPGFRFSVKVPKEISHTRKLVDTVEPLDRFLGETAALGNNLGPLLLQLPPTLRYDESVTTGFLELLRSRFEGEVVCEPRNASWFTDEADRLLADFQVARVAADPALGPRASDPGGWPGIAYWRLHGTPRTYYSAYSIESLDRLAETVRAAHPTPGGRWCIFDNTAAGHALDNALSLVSLL